MKIDKSKISSSSPNNSFASLMGGDENIIVDIPIEDLIPTENQPFLVLDDERMEDLVEDIKINGVLEPIIVTEDNGKFRILAGHRRTHASKRAGKETVPAIIRGKKNGSEELIITNTNLTQRKEFLPSELAKAYKMQLEGYSKLNAHSVRTTAQIAENLNVGKRMIQYYLKLNDLVPGLLDLVDNKTITVKAGAILSDLSEYDQERLYKFVISHGIKKIDEDKALSISHKYHIDKKITEVYLKRLLLSKYQNDQRLRYDSYIVDQSCIANTYSAINDIYQSKILKATMVLKKEQYSKLQAAQDKINKQIEVIQKILESN